VSVERARLFVARRPGGGAAGGARGAAGAWGWYAAERRPWLAHVSVARVGRTGGDLRAIAPLDPFPATAVLLLRSWPGSRYEPLHRVALPV
jgi:hypothetical protein